MRLVDYFHLTPAIRCRWCCEQVVGTTLTVESIKSGLSLDVPS